MPKRDRYEDDEDERPIRPRKKASGLVVAGIIVWCVAAAITLLVGLIWLLIMRASETVFQQCSVSASAAAVLIGVYIIARSAEKVLLSIRTMRA